MREKNLTLSCLACLQAIAIELSVAIAWQAIAVKGLTAIAKLDLTTAKSVALSQAKLAKSVVAFRH